MEDIQNNVPVNDTDPEKTLKKQCKKEFSLAGLKLSAFAIFVILVEIVWSVIFNTIEKKFNFEFPGYMSYVQILVCLHIIGLAFAVFLFHFKPKVKLPSKKLGFWNFVLYLLATFGIGVPLALVGNVISMIIAYLAGEDVLSANASLNIATMGIDTLLGKALMILVVVITAPIVEEHLFRKFLIDSIGRWGVIVSAVTSGLLFGLFHGNLSQFFFATFIGFIFANVYLRTGRVRYSIFMHMTVNGVNAIIMLLVSGLDLPRLQELSDEMLSFSTDAEAMAFLNNLAPADLSLLGGFMFYMIFIGCYLLFVFAGFVLFMVFFKKIFFYEKPFKSELSVGKTFLSGYLSIGMIIFFLVCIFQFAMYYIK